MNTQIFSRVKSVLGRHWLIVVGAIFMAILVEAPLIAFPFYAGDRYQGINIAHFGTDEHYYLSRAKEVLEGKNLGQPILSEWKERQDPTFSHTEYVLMLPFRALGWQDNVNVATVYNIYNFLGLIFLILLIYSLTFLISGDKLLSTAVALFVVGGYSIIYNKGLFYNDFNIYGRSLPPYAHSIPFISLLICLHLGLVKRVKVFLIPAALLFGMLFYLYFYAWTFAMAVFGSLILIFLLAKKWQEAKETIVTALVGTVLGSYVLYGLYSLFHSGVAEQFSYFLMSSNGHNFVFSKTGFATALVLIAFLFKKRGNENRFFLFAIVLAGWVALNQQVITGKFIQYGHYYWYFIVPLSIVISFYAVFSLIKWKKVKVFLLWLCIVTAFINTAFGQYQSFFTTVHSKLREQDYASVINELNNLGYGVVLMDDSGNSFPYLVSIYTDKDLFWAGFALVHEFSVDRLKEGIFVHNYLDKDKRVSLKNSLKEELGDKKITTRVLLFQDLEGYQSGLSYYDYQKQFYNPKPELLEKREKLLDSLEREYQEYNLDNKIEQMMAKSSVKYIIWDKLINPNWDLSFMTNMKEITQKDHITLYVINQPKDKK